MHMCFDLRMVVANRPLVRSPESRLGSWVVSPRWFRQEVEHFPSPDKADPIKGLFIAGLQ